MLKGGTLEPVTSEIKSPLGNNTADFSPEYSSDSLYSKQKSESKWARFVDSFHRKESGEAEGKQLAKGISRRHLTLMALVTGVGTGLLVGSGSKLNVAGPLFLVLGYAIVGSFLYPTLQAAGEMAVNYSELSGGYNNYPRKFIDESIAFAVTWNYCIQWLSVIALELVTASITIRYWNTSINADVWVAIFFVLIVVINFIGAKGYGEGEFVFGCLKLSMIIGFIIMAIVVDVGGGPKKEYIGGKYWHHPGSHTNFKGLCAVFVTGAFSLGQSEFVALSAAEQPNPRKAIPAACKLIFWRILVLFLGSLTMVGLLVPHDSKKLMGSGGGGSHASPFVLAAALHGVQVVPHIINTVILFSVVSVASSALYSSSRTLQSLAEQGFAPSYFNYIDKAGRPFRALCICTFFGLFSFIAAYKEQETVFNWLLAISGLSQVFTWTAICVSHIRFRYVLRYNGISTDALGYKASTGVIGSVYATIVLMLILVAQFWIALYPVHAKKPDAETFFQNYLGACVFLLFYIGHKLYTRNWSLWIKVEDIDINADRTIFDQELLDLQRQEEAERFKNYSIFKKALKVMFA